MSGGIFIQIFKKGATKHESNGIERMVIQTSPGSRVTLQYGTQRNLGVIFMQTNNRSADQT